ncbi:hypothetical protein [Enterococcus sp. BWR-S5]|uniref:hypothetical protein n=1 Tax=Enterococcus sp. BWR-S5 TaxID=2787714 RepID=UPI00192400E8|nr:hypothetical protein [Enterococcus sp. BWR-S5]MBL1224510.1 hypothetical protein [Enterococcus sp. BWR-S5]
MVKAFSFSTFSLAAWVTISIHIYLQGKNIGKINYFLLFQLLVGLFLVFLPNLIQRIFHISFPIQLFNFYQLFLIASVFVGTGLNFVNKIPHWDKALHVLCGILFSLLAYSLLTLIVDTRASHSIWLFIFGGLCFSLTIGVLWEFWEFFCDSFFGMNLQQFSGPQKVPKLGQLALMDTMIDLLADFVGALVIAVLTLFQYFHQDDYLLRYLIMKN